MTELRAPSNADPGSFRDPSGVVLIANGRVFRTVEQSAWKRFDAVRSSGVLDKLVSAGRVVRFWPVDAGEAPSELTNGLGPHPRWLFEHERVPFISYPYEWPFSLLKRAALHTLDLHLELLESGFTLSDASAYNIQFRGTRPVFIDILSIRPYQEGEYWAGYRQFCEQFLNPLLLTSVRGIDYQAWFRGSLEGIPVEDMARILPLRTKLSWQALLHVVLHAKITRRVRRKGTSAGSIASRSRSAPMPRAVLTRFLRSMRAWVGGLRPRWTGGNLWSDYTKRASYTPEETEAKRSVVARYVERHKPVELLDLGCNTGRYAQIALSAGAGRVIGFDFDHGALEAAVRRADDRHLDFLPLFLNAANPSPDQGWGQRERRGLKDRSRPDGICALALLHHIVIGHNVPLARAVEWLVALAPSGLIEFVPKQDPMVRQMLTHREDFFPSYQVDAFRGEMARRAHIVHEHVVSSSGRTVFEYQR